MREVDVRASIKIGFASIASKANYLNLAQTLNVQHQTNGAPYLAARDAGQPTPPIKRGRYCDPVVLLMLAAVLREPFAPGQREPPPLSLFQFVAHRLDRHLQLGRFVRAVSRLDRDCRLPGRVGLQLPLVFDIVKKEFRDLVI